MTETIPPQQAAAWLADGTAILIDVREADEFKGEHIAYANSLPLGDLEKSLAQMNISLSRKIIFQCLKGGRGEKACLNVKACGACKNEVYNLEGGITAWKEAGLPVIGHSAGLSILRQVQIIIGGLIAVAVMLGFAGLGFGFALAGLFGAALCFAGLTGWCGLAMLLRQMPWNKNAP